MYNNGAVDDSGSDSLDEPIEVVPHDLGWIEDARRAADQLRAVVGHLASGVEHIGSTAVPGLAAKPIVDLAVAVEPAHREEAVDALQRLGYVDLGEAGVSGRRYLRWRRSPPAVNVHLMAPGSALWIENLLLRDYLRSHPDAAADYAGAKLSAASLHPTLLAYSEAKADHVQHLLIAAREWAAGAGSPRSS